MKVNLAEDLVDISQANLAELSEQIQQTGRPKLLTRGGTGHLIVLPISDYEEIAEALEVAAGLLRGERDLATGKVADNTSMQERLRARLAASQRAATDP